MSLVFNTLDMPAAADARVHCLSDGSLPLTLAELGRNARQAGAWLEVLAGRSGTVAALLTASHDCLATLFGAFRSGMTLVSLPHPARGMDAEEYLAQIGTMCALTDATHLLCDPGLTALLSTGTGSRAPVQRVEYVGAPRRDRGTGELRAVHLWEHGDAQRDCPLPRCTRRQPDLHVRLARAPRGRRRLQLVAPFARHGTDRPGDVRHVLGEPPVVHAVRARPDDPRVVLGRSGAVGCERAPTTGPRPQPRLRSRCGWPPDPFGRPVHSISPRSGASWSGASRCPQTASAGSKPSQGSTACPRTRLCPGYGMAEAALAVAIDPPTSPWSSVQLDPDALAVREWQEVVEAGVELVSCGPPVLHTEVRSTGDTPWGELEIRSPSLLDAYVGDDSPPLTEDGWLHTADLGHVHNGEIFVAGRTDDVLIVAGRNIDARELDALVAAHPTCRPGNAACVPDGSGRYVVVVEPRTEEIGPAELRAGARDIRFSLTQRFGAGPSAVVFIARGTLPKTPSGKVRRNHLRTLWAGGRLQQVASA